MKGKQSRGRPVPQRGRLITPVQLDRKKGKGYKAVVVEAGAEAGVAEAVVADAVVTAPVESKE